MFGNVGWGEMVIIVIAGLVILGPERLPGAMSWLARSLKQVRAYATGAQTQLKEELGPEFEDLRKPLSELQQLRGMSPRAAITKHLLDGDDSLFTGDFTTDGQATAGRAGGSAEAGAVPTRPRSVGDQDASRPARDTHPADGGGGDEPPLPPRPGGASPAFDEDAT